MRCDDRLERADASGDGNERAEADGGTANAFAAASSFAAVGFFFGDDSERTATGAGWSNGAFDAETGVAAGPVPAKPARVADAPRRR